MSDFPFSIPRRDADVVNGVSYSGDTLTLTRAEGSDLTTTIPNSYFAIDLFPRTFNADLDGLQYLSGVGPDPAFGPNPTSFINLPFNYKIIGLSMSIDSDGGSFDYDFQIYERDANTSGGGAAVGDVISFDAVTFSTSRSALFNTPHSVTPSKDIGLNLDSTATGNSGEYVLKLWCQTV